MLAPFDILGSGQTFTLERFELSFVANFVITCPVLSLNSAIFRKLIKWKTGKMELHIYYQKTASRVFKRLKT